MASSPAAVSLALTQFRESGRNPKDLVSLSQVPAHVDFW